MYCRHCGKEIDDKAVICVHCGLMVDPVSKHVNEVPSAKFCKNCGKELPPAAVICSNCGVAVGEIVSNAPKKKLNTFGLTGFILSICSIWGGALFGILPIIALVFSIIGMTKNKKCRLNGFSIAGLTISIIFTLFWLLIWILALSLGFSDQPNNPNSYPYYPDYNIDITSFMF